MAEQALQKGMERDTLNATVLSATTLEECERAKNLIIAWMQEHPRDYGILDVGEQVAMIMDGYAQEAAVSHPVA